MVQPAKFHIRGHFWTISQGLCRDTISTVCPAKLCNYPTQDSRKNYATGVLVRNQEEADVGAKADG